MLGFFDLDFVYLYDTNPYYLLLPGNSPPVPEYIFLKDSLISGYELWQVGGKNCGIRLRRD